MYKLMEHLEIFLVLSQIVFCSSDQSHQCSSQGLGQAQVDSLPALGEKRHRADPRGTRLLGNHCRAVASGRKGSHDRASLNWEVVDLGQAWEG